MPVASCNLFFLLKIINCWAAIINQTKITNDINAILTLALKLVRIKNVSINTAAINPNILARYFRSCLLYEDIENISAPKPNIIKVLATPIEAMSGINPLKINNNQPMVCTNFP